MTYQEAKQKFKIAFPEYKIRTGIDLDEEFVFVVYLEGQDPSMTNTRFSVDKQTSEIHDFFPKDPKTYSDACKNHIVEKHW